MFSNNRNVMRGIVVALVVLLISFGGCKSFRDVERESIPVRPASSN